RGGSYLIVGAGSRRLQLLTAEPHLLLQELDVALGQRGHLGAVGGERLFTAERGQDVGDAALLEEAREPRGVHVQPFGRRPDRSDGGFLEQLVLRQGRRGRGGPYSPRFQKRDQNGTGPSRRPAGAHASARMGARLRNAPPARAEERRVARQAALRR